MTTPELEQACQIVAEKIMGWEKGPGWWHIDDYPHPLSNKLSTDAVMADYLLTGDGMVEVMEALKSQTVTIQLSCANCGDWFVVLRACGAVGIKNSQLTSLADNPPEALILAAAQVGKLL